MENVSNLSREFFKLIDEADKIFVTGHVSPDGDCIGSVMALYVYLSKICNKNVYFGFDGVIPYNLKKYVNKYQQFNNFENEEFDLLIVLDCGDEDRLGKYKCIVSNSKKSVCIDHHLTNTNFANLNIVSVDMSSTGELLYHLLCSENKKIDKEMAEMIYIAILTDTGSFSYDCTSGSTHIVVADLMNKGIDIGKIDNEINNSKPINVVKAYINCISNINFYYDNKLGIARIAQNTLYDNNVSMNDIEGIVEFIREIKDIEVSCVLKEKDIDDVKVSLRSKHDLNVALISKVFGGGGHKKAAGFNLNMTIEEAEKRIVSEFEKYLGE